MVRTPALPDDYPQLLARLKGEISSARTRAALAVNEELIGLYWRIGREIHEREEAEGWGARVVPTLSRDLRSAFPEMTGLAERNLRYMRDFARAWPDEAMLPQAVAKLPWGHVRCLLDKLDNPAARLWYAQSTVEYGWSRKVLEHHIATGRYEREGKALTNFSSTLPAPESELVQEIVHEDYNFEFLGLAGDVHEGRIERSLIAEIESFMLELDLKLGKFRPQYAGQVNFYVNVIDDQMRQEHHGATIGLVLCASRNKTVARYALEGMTRPLGVARYTTTGTLVERVPEELGDQLPALEQISAGVQLIVERHSDEVAEAEADEMTDAGA